MAWYSAICELLAKEARVIRLWHGFTRNKWWHTNRISFLDSVTKGVIQEHAIDLGNLDFSKALDKEGLSYDIFEDSMENC